MKNASVNAVCLLSLALGSFACSQSEKTFTSPVGKGQAAEASGQSSPLSATLEVSCTGLVKQVPLAGVTFEVKVAGVGKKGVVLCDDDKLAVTVDQIPSGARGEIELTIRSGNTVRLTGRAADVVFQPRTGPIATLKLKEPAAAGLALWGHLDGFLEPTLINVPPNATIAVCADAKMLPPVMNAMEAWATTLGRLEHLKLEATCDPAGATGWVSVVDPVSAQDKEDCQSDAFADPAFKKTEFGGGIMVCHPDQEMVGLLIHEVGHLWGMCDQYTDDTFEVGMHSSCSKVNASASATTSVMNGTGPKELTADDVAGIKALAARTDIPANAVWKKFLAGDDSPEDAADGEPGNEPVGASGDDPSGELVATVFVAESRD